MGRGKIINSSYGSIPHMSTSKIGQQADKKIIEGQELILTKKARDYKDLIIVTEKIDGSNVGIIKKDGNLIAITRAGYAAASSPYEQHALFDKYVYRYYDLFWWIPEGWRICGEWCIQAHGTKMKLDYVLFLAFDIIGNDNNRLNYIDFIKICAMHHIKTVPLLHIGQPISINNAVKLLGNGHYGNPEVPEGVVYRCEREGKVDFLAKWVQPNKVDGKYMKEEIWNVDIEIVNFLRWTA